MTRSRSIAACRTSLPQRSPHVNEVESTEIYARGRELREKRCRPIVPAHLDSHLKRSTLASVEFEFVFEREPEVGDILRCEHIATAHAPQANAFYFGDLIAAWHRQIAVLQDSCTPIFTLETILRF